MFLRCKIDTKGGATNERVVVQKGRDGFTWLELRHAEKS